jgi:hypothetical protein
MQPQDFEALLRRLDMNNTEFARHWRVAVSTVRRLLGGKRRITPRNRKEICETAVEILIGRELGPLQPQGSIVDRSSEGPQESRIPAKLRARKAGMRSRPAPSPAAVAPRPIPKVTVASLRAAAVRPPAKQPAPKGCRYLEFGTPCGNPTVAGSQHCAWHQRRALVEASL